MAKTPNTCVSSVRLFRKSVKADRGFTLLELFIAIFITGIVSTAVYQIYNMFFRQTHIQDMVVESQQNARVAIDAMERELMNAGYAAGTGDILTEATGGSVEFLYTDPTTDTSMSVTAGKRLKVRYALETTGGVQYLIRDMGICADPACGTYTNARQAQQVIPYAQGLTLTYYDINGNTIVPASQSDRNNIKFITVNLVTQTKANVPGTNSPKSFMVETHIRLRNIGVGTVSLDTTPPVAPIGLQVRDPGLCGRLKVKWTENTEGDMSGYKIYYGVASGNYTGVINIPLTILSSTANGYSCTHNAGSLECTIFPKNIDGSWSIDHTPSTAAPGTGTKYYVAVKAYDNSLNHSPFSAEVSGNPAVSNPTFDSGPDDSTINPVKPVAAAGLKGADGASDGQVALSWTAYNTANNPDVVGFRIYRSTSPFTAYPVDPATQPNVTWIAGEPGSGKPVLTQNSTTFTDPGPGLLGCKTYYYAIAPVNCDPTLITDEGGDPNTKKYIQTDYAATCGDGTTACSAGTGFAAVTGSDTSPTKTTPPASPTINARAGWKRVALSLTQPADPDLSQTCIYANQGSTYPALQVDTGMFPKVMGCYQVDTSTTPGAIRLYENNGIFTVSQLGQSASTSFWHNSMASLTTTPSLLDTGTYSYRAVSFDLCGNGSAPTAAQATTTLCGEDPSSGEKPPAVTNATASSCSSPVALSWMPVSSDISLPSTPTNPYDLAGYRIFRSTNSTDWSAATLLNTSAPYWGSTYDDTFALDSAGVSDPGSYYYRIVSTDCPYEKVNPPAAAIRTDMISNYLYYMQTGPVSPGRILRDEKCPGGSSCTKDLHRAVLTGVDMDNSVGNGTGNSTPVSDYSHSRVTLFFNNTSAGTMTIQNAGVSWVNSSAFLREINIGGGRSGVGSVTTSIATGSTTSVSGNPPYTSEVSNIAIASGQIPAGARYVPVTFRFRDISDNKVDMREDQLLITISVRNDSTGTTNCLTYLTVSGGTEGVAVPLGPTVTATQQNQPSSPTFSYAVPGPSGLNTVPSGADGQIVVGSSTNVTISANVSSNTVDENTGLPVAVSSAKLYYTDSSKTTTTAPSSGYTAVTMTNTGGDIWSGQIPSKDGERVWYYIVAADADGNFDRDPEMSDGAYVYDQKNFNVCDVTPNAPAALTANVSGSGPYDVSLSWTAPTAYTTGATINGGLDTIKYRIFRTFNGVTTQIGTDQTAKTYTDSGLAAGVYSYTVKAINSCGSPGPNVSAASNVAATCAGNSGQATLTVSPSTIHRGDSYSVTVMDCLAINGGYASTVETINSTVGFTGFSNTSTAPVTGSINPYNPTITETGPATGTFNITIATTDNILDTGKLLTLPTDTISVYYPYANPATKTVSVVVDPCTTIPKAPTGLAGSVAANNKNLTLSWTAVTQNTDNTAITDLAGYSVYEKVCKNTKPNCTGSDIIKDWFLRTSVGSGATSATVSVDQSSNFGGGIYYFRVTATDSCATPNESAISNVWNENN